ncbi:hypothetical protein M3215_11660 [Bacillus cytotoxicus]|uniref:Uncharacterized protein n=1 Tax=Bacillus cytotoxicus TaxID=580165 RepID=A0ACC6A6D6_9BACI|nr:hypothetical protein [Bacillus cytotoxicus]
MNQKGQQIILCKKCGGNKITLLGKFYFYMVTAVCTFLFGILIITIPFAIITGFLMLLSPFIPIRLARCAECKYIQKIDKETFQKFKKEFRA